jgi:type I restriction enzyme S subunit
MSKDKKLIPQLRFPEFLNDEEWAEKLIGDITISESSSMALNKLELKPKGYPVYGADSIVGYIDNFQQQEKYISIVKDGSGVGRLNLCQSHSSILGTLACLKSKNQKLYYLDWIYYLLNTVDFSVYVKGAGIPHIYYSDFKFEKIATPKPKEQQKIASCLSSLDEVITAHSQKLELLKDHKKGLMQNLFPQEGEKVPKYRFKEFEKDGVWVEKKLGEIGEPLMCKRIFKEQTTTNPNNGIPFYKIGTFGKLADAYISIELYEEFKSKYSFPKKGDILISASGTIGRLVIYDGSPAYFQDSNIVWLGNDEKLVLNEFLYHCYSIVNWQTSDGGVISRLYNSDLKNIDVKFPKNPKEQQKIASCLSSLDDLIKAQAEKIEQLKLHKKGLMQGLFPKIND